MTKKRFLAEVAAKIKVRNPIIDVRRSGDSVWLIVLWYYARNGRPTNIFLGWSHTREKAGVKAGKFLKWLKEARHA